MSTTRRSFLRGGAALATGALSLGPAALRALAATDRPIEPGLQLYTVRELLEVDFRGTLEKVAAIGYREVQVSTRAGHAPREIRAMLSDAGLVCPSIHFAMRSSVEAEIEAAKLLGASSVFLSAPMRVLRIENDRIHGRARRRDSRRVEDDR